MGLSRGGTDRVPSGAVLASGARSDAYPAFELTQDCDFLTVAIRVPHARASEFDVYFEGWTSSSTPSRTF